MPKLSPIKPEHGWFRGYGKVFEYHVVNLDGTVRDLTSFTAFTWKLFRAGSGKDAVMIFEKTLGDGVQVTDAENGEVQVTIETADTENLEANRNYTYFFDGTDGGIPDVLAYATDGAWLGQSPG